MLKIIRNINWGYIIILTGFIIIASGISMQSPELSKRTFLCFEKGCVYVQAISNILLGIFCVMIGIYMIFRK